MKRDAIPASAHSLLISSRLWITSNMPRCKDTFVHFAIFKWKSCPSATPSSKRYLSTHQKRGADANHPTLLRGQSCPLKGGSREIPARYRPPLPLLKRVRPGGPIRSRP